MDSARTMQAKEMCLFLAQASLSQSRLPLRRILRVWKLAQLYLEEVLVERPCRTTAIGHEVARYTLSQFRVVKHPGP